MTIQYALTRTEIAAGFFRSLRTSPRFRITIGCYAVAFSGFELMLTGAFSRPLTLQDGATAILAALGFFLFMPAFLFLRGKTSLRTLTIAPEGLSTQIGKIQPQRPWTTIKIVAEAPEYVLIASASGNAFFIPNRAFSSSEQKAEFVTRINGWRHSQEKVR